MDEHGNNIAASPLNEGNTMQIELNMTPAEAGQGSIRQVGFNIGARLTVLVEVSVSEDGEERVEITTGGLPAASQFDTLLGVLNLAMESVHDARVEHEKTKGATSAAVAASEQDEEEGGI